MRLIFDVFAQTLRTLWAHKLRSFLTIISMGLSLRSRRSSQRDSRGARVSDQLTHSFSVGKNRGGLRPWIVCSNP